MQRPTGYTLICVVLAFILCGKVGALLAERPAGVHGPVAAGLDVLVLVLMAVALEALWRMRPWCARAFACMAVAVVLRQVVGLAGTGAVLDQVMGIVFLAAELGVVLAYVHRRARARFGPAPVLRAPPRVPLRRGSVLPPQMP